MTHAITHRLCMAPRARICAVWRQQQGEIFPNHIYIYIYIDTRYKRDKYGSNTNFELDLPQTVECPPNTVCYVDDIVLPNTITTVQIRVNDRLYFAVFYNTLVRYRSLVIPEQKYTLMSFAND